MKVPLTRSDCKIQVSTDEEPSPRKTTKYDATTLLIVFLTVFLATGSATYFLYQSQRHKTEMHLKSAEFRKVMQSILMEANELMKNGGVMVEVQVLDKNHNLLWFKPIDEETLKDEERVENEILNKLEESEDDESRHPSIIRYPRSVDSPRTRAYVVSHQTQFVNCDRLKPIPRGKYLVPPSLHALHRCYEYGVTMEELDRGILRRQQGGEFRYNLPQIYVSCNEVFNDQMDELTDELRVDYERCKLSGALDEQQQKIVEDRFAPQFVEPSRAPSNIVISSPSYPATTLPPPTTTPPQTTTPTTTTHRPTSSPVDPRYTECSHVEKEMVDDSFESPSPDALQRCQRYGVTHDELRRGIMQNPNRDRPRYDVSNLYLPCEWIFGGNVVYLTSELTEDYRRCKSVNGLGKATQDKVEQKFYEVLYDEKADATTSRRPTERRPTTTSTTTTAEIVTTTTTTRSDQSKRQTTAFDNNCKRVDNKDVYVCTEVTVVQKPVY